MKLIDVQELKSTIMNWRYKHLYYHPYSKAKDIPIEEVLDLIDLSPTIETEAVKGQGNKFVFEYTSNNQEPVVHCRDCKYGIWHIFVDKNGKEDHYIECINPDGLNRDVVDNSYCNCGDKREESK